MTGIVTRVRRSLKNRCLNLTGWSGPDPRGRFYTAAPAGAGIVFRRGRESVAAALERAARPDHDAPPQKPVPDLPPGYHGLMAAMRDIQRVQWAQFVSGESPRAMYRAARATPCANHDLRQFKQLEDAKRPVRELQARDRLTIMDSLAELQQLNPDRWGCYVPNQHPIAGRAKTRHERRLARQIVLARVRHDWLCGRFTHVTLLDLAAFGVGRALSLLGIRRPVSSPAKAGPDPARSAPASCRSPRRIHASDQGPPGPGACRETRTKPSTARAARTASRAEKDGPGHAGPSPRGRRCSTADTI